MNNRQNGRRRGRGGVRPPNGGNLGNDRGNRIDNRSRGNASQLYEKYKTLARDAQTQGDRVLTEYYLQFADHYFRVLSENRPRFEEQNRRQRDEGFDEEMENEGDAEITGEEQREAPPRRQPRYERPEGEPSRERREQREQPRAAEAAEPEAPVASVDEANGERRPRRGRRTFATTEGSEQPRLDIDRLPPALARASEAGEEQAAAEPVNGATEAAPAPRPRRPRRPRNSEGTIAVEA